MSIDLYSKAPNKRASIMHLPEGDNVTAFDGQAGWLGAPGRPVREMHGSDLDGASIDADLRLPETSQADVYRSEGRRRQKIGDKTAYEVVGRREGKPPIRLYFDQQSGLLLRLVRYGDTALGRLPTQTGLHRLSRRGWREASVSVDAGASQWTVHDSGDRGEAECAGGGY